MKIEGMKSRDKKGASYEEAMKEAFNEIFQNLKEIEKDTEKKRQKVDFERRRGSAPPSALRVDTTAFRKPKEVLSRQLSSPMQKSNRKRELKKTLSTPLTPTTSLSTMQWVLACFEEEEENV